MNLERRRPRRHVKSRRGRQRSASINFPAQDGPSTHALSHLAVSHLHACRAAGVLRVAKNTILDSVASGCFVLFLWLVEPVLPVAGFLLDAAGLSAGHV